MKGIIYLYVYRKREWGIGRKESHTGRVLFARCQKKDRKANIIGKASKLCDIKILHREIVNENILIHVGITFR